MRVFFWAEFYTPHIGGVETVVAGLAEELVRRGHEAIVVTNHEPPSTPKTEQINGVLVYRFNLIRSVTQRDLRGLRVSCTEILALKRTLRPDLEHIHSTGPMLLAHQMVQRDAPSPTICTLHCTHDRLPALLAAGGAAANLLRKSSAVITVSDLLRCTVLREIPSLGDRVFFVAHGLRIPIIPPDSLPFSPPVALCLGRLVRDKGFDLALRALAAVRPQFPDLKIIIAGGGIEQAPLAQMAVELGINDATHFIGWVQAADVPKIINQATLTLMPSRWQETAALVAVESAMMGRPVIATAVGGTHELVDHGNTGLLVETENIEAITAALKTLLGNPDEARRMGRAARERALALYTFERYFAAHLAWYELAAKGAPANA